LWTTEAGKPFARFDGSSLYFQVAALSSDGQRILTGLSDSAILWDANTGERIHTLSGNISPVLSSVAFAKDGRSLLTGSGDGTAIIWDADTGRRVRAFKGHDSPVLEAVLSPDGRRLLTGSGDGTAILWDAGTGHRDRVFRGERRDNLVIGGLPESLGTQSIAFSPDGRRVLVCSQKLAAVSWDLESGHQVRFGGPDHVVGVASFSPDGHRVVTGSADGAIVIWDASTGRKLRTFVGHHGKVISVAFHPDGRRALTGSSDGTARFWDLGTGDELLRLVELDGGREWLVTTPEGLFDGSPGGYERVNFRFPGALPGDVAVSPVARFFQDYYYPGLLAEVWRGQRPMPQVLIGRGYPPSLTIVSPTGGVESGTERVTLEVDVRERGGGVRGPWLVHNGVRVSTPGHEVKRGPTARWRFTESLIPGENYLQVGAANAAGSWQSEPVVLPCPRYGQDQVKPDLYLLAVGIDSYLQKELAIRLAGADARAIVELFQQRGQGIYRRSNVKLLLNVEATKQNILRGLDGMAGARPEDVIIVFVAGHGYTTGQRYYFLPYDFQNHLPNELTRDIIETALPADMIADRMGKAGALKRVIILDTCQSGTVLGQGRSATNLFAYRGAIARLGQSQPGVFTIAASAADGTTRGIDKLGHGLLTHALLASLSAVDADSRRGESVQLDPPSVVDVFSWFRSANDLMSRLLMEFAREPIHRGMEVHFASQGMNFAILSNGRRPSPTGSH
jgi:hypothetical protein